MTTHPTHPPSGARTAGAPSRGLIGLAGLGALAQVLGGVLETVDRVEAGEPGFGFRTALIGIAYACLLGAVVALSRSGAARRTPAVRTALVVAATGWALSAVAQILLNVDRDLAEQVLFPVATVAIGAGMLGVGVGVVRARRWSGWRRWTPLACGAYPFVAIFPGFAAAGGPNFLVLTGWGLCWLALAAALRLEAGDGRRPDPTAS